MQKSLLLGCGNSRVKKVCFNDQTEWVGELITVDFNPHCGAKIIWDLERRPLPFYDDEFDEIGAFDVLEHLSQQGDFRSWFDEMAEYHRILKPGGMMYVLVPIGEDALADPGHTRFFSEVHFFMLNQAWYDERLAAGAPVTDYRWHWKKSFDLLHMSRVEDHHIAVILRKPA